MQVTPWGWVCLFDTVRTLRACVTRAASAKRLLSEKTKKSLGRTNAKSARKRLPVSTSSLIAYALDLALTGASLSADNAVSAHAPFRAVVGLPSGAGSAFALSKRIRNAHGKNDPRLPVVTRSTSISADNAVSALRHHAKDSFVALENARTHLVACVFSVLATISHADACTGLRRWRCLAGRRAAVERAALSKSLGRLLSARILLAESRRNAVAQGRLS